MPNEIGTVTGDGWALIRYGEHPHERALQVFGKPQAEQMVGYFRNTWNRIKRAFVGMPIYRGHPDQVDQLRRERDRAKDPALRAQLDAMANAAAAKWTDRTVYGTIADMEVREEGLAIKPVLTEAGASLVNEHGLKFFSPHWLGMELPPRDGKPVKAPVFMMSIGLTDRPNIGGTSLVNEHPAPNSELRTPNSDPTMPKWLIELLGLANEATEEQARAAVVALQARPEPTALANEQTARTTAETRATELNSQLSTLNSQLSQATAQANEAATALANAQTELATVTKQRNEALVDAAVKTGRIAEAAKPVWLGRLERDFAAESTALANEQPALKTHPRTDNLGARKPASEASTKFASLVNERVSKGEAYLSAWDAVKATPEGKALFEQMSSAAS